MLQFQTTFVQLEPSYFKSSSQACELQFMNNKQVVMTLMHLRWLLPVLFYSPSASLTNVLIFRRKINTTEPGVWECGYGISDIRWMKVMDSSTFLLCQQFMAMAIFTFKTLFFTDTICSGWKECLTLNNKTRNNVAQWQIKGHSVNRATTDNFYCGLYGRFIFINTFYRSKLDRWHMNCISLQFR